MPLVSSIGFPQTVPSKNPEGTLPTKNPTMQNTLDQQPYVADSFVNRNAYNPETYADQFGLLQRYSLGSRITVTYFMISTPLDGLQRSTDIDQSNVRNSIQTNYTQINNLEIVMQAGLRYDFDNQTTESRVTGEALLYPGLKPRMGDEFVMSVSDGTFGIFRVTKIDRLAWRQGSNIRITFFYNRQATNEEINVLTSSVTKVVYFDTSTYLGDTTTLLKEQSYVNLQTLKQMKQVLTKYYYDNFYNSGFSSLIAPANYYDPYIVKFMNSITTISDTHYKPLQLYQAIANFESTIWGRLLDPINNTLNNINQQALYVKFRANRWDVYITPVVNELMIYVENPTKLLIKQEQNNSDIDISTSLDNFSLGYIPGSFQSALKQLQYISTIDNYIFSSNFYSGNTTEMTLFEYTVYYAVTKKSLGSDNDISVFIDTYLSSYTQLTLDQQFNFIPIYLYLIDLAIKTTTNPNSIGFMT